MLEARRAVAAMQPGDSERLTHLQKALGEVAYANDSLIEKWEREIAEGRMPNLDEEG